MQTNRCGTSSNWEEAWKRRFVREYRRGAEPEKRGTESLHRYLETLIVCDKKFLDYHKNIDQETYVLTIMNMVVSLGIIPVDRDLKLLLLNDAITSLLWHGNLN
jgi:hypothetical protein